jgi:threonine aldolase
LQGDRGRLTVDTIAKWVNPDDVHFPTTQLVSLEDTANRGGGAVYDFEEIKRIRLFCNQHNLPLHLDGARLMNALVYTGIDPKEYTAQFDSISLCLSKGLGAPVGSLLIGTRDFIKKSRRVRKVFGGGMRQAGIIAAGGLYALKHNVERLKIDHDAAKMLEETLTSMSWVKEVMPVQTNIVVAILHDPSKRDAVIEKLAMEHIRIMAFGPGMIRMVTHLDNSIEDIQRVSEVVKSLTL